MTSVEHPGLGQHLLLVDDDVALASALARELTAAGWRVETARDGEEALRALRSKRFDALVVDLWMPGRDGVAVIEYLAEAEHPPVMILLSGYINIPTTVRAMRAGASDVLEKPVSAMALDRSLRAAIDRRRNEPDESGVMPVARPSPDSQSLPELNRFMIEQAWEASEHNLSRAARALGVPRTTLRDRLRRYGLR